MQTQKAYRHGDVVLLQISKLPKGLLSAKTKILMVGNTGNHHSFDKGTFYPQDDKKFVIGYFRAKGTTLLHSDHGEKSGGTRKAKLPDGIYEVRRQVESTHQGMKPVID